VNSPAWFISNALTDADFLAATEDERDSLLDDACRAADHAMHSAMIDALQRDADDRMLFSEGGDLFSITPFGWDRTSCYGNPVDTDSGQFTVAFDFADTARMLHDVSYNAQSAIPDLTEAAQIALRSRDRQDGSLIESLPAIISDGMQSVLSGMVSNAALHGVGVFSAWSSAFAAWGFYSDHDDTIIVEQHEMALLERLVEIGKELEE